MNWENLMRAFGQAVGAAMAEHGKFDFKFDEEDGGQPLSALDLTDACVEDIRVTLLPSDLVRVHEGENLAITVDDPEAEDALRFCLHDGRLAIRRRRGGAKAVIDITTAAPRALSIAGAGAVEAEALAADAKISIGGAGTVRVRSVRGTALSVKIGGSGRVETAGAVESLRVAIGGSGRFAAPTLEVERAEIKIGGSGHVEFASDGELEAKIGGSGHIVVHGTPRCSLKAGGSGRLRCVSREPREEAPRAA